MDLTVKQALQQAMTAHKEGKLQDAERLYRAILESNPAHPDANHNLAVLAVAVNKVNAALPLFKAALEANPQVEQFWLSYIDALIKEQQFEIAKQVIQQGKQQGVDGERLNSVEAQLSPKTQKKNTTIASPSQELISSLLERYKTRRFSDAEKIAISIAQEFPQHQFAWKMLGAIFGQTGRNSEATHANNRAVALSPLDVAVHSNLGNTLRALGRLDEAETSFRKAIVLKPDFAKAYYNLGNTLKEVTRLNEAEASYTQAIRLHPNYVEARYNLGITLKELGRLEAAEVSYAQAIALNPNYAEAHNNLGITLKELGRLEAAEASYAKAIALKPNYAEAHNNLGNTFKELGSLDEAEASYTQAIALKPNYAEAHSNLGITLRELGRLEAAEASHAKAIALRPSYAEAHNNLGITLKELGKLEAAEVSYSQAIALKPDYAEALTNRSKLLIDKKEYKAALRDADACILEKRNKALPFVSLYALGRVHEIYDRLAIQSKGDAANISLAAFAAFIYDVKKKATDYNFCNNPIDFVHITNLSFHINNSDAYVKEIIDELNKIKTLWEPSGKATVGGFQSTPGNLFKNPTRKIAQLKSIIIDEIKKYYLKFQNEQCVYIQKFPNTVNLTGWTVMLKQQGHQTAHIHPDGWLSGVIYLKVVPSLGRDEGAIEFSLNSQHYCNADSPRVTFLPKVGDIVFFPSSLHHRTIPFTTDGDRIIVSFDLIPEHSVNQLTRLS